MSLDIKQINQNELTPDQYIKEDCSSLKKIIVLHHTAGGSSPKNAIYGWQKTTERVATAFVIAGKPTKNDTHKDGDIFQAFGSKYWAYHIAFSAKSNNVPQKYHNFTLEQQIAKASIGIEICNFGGLTKDSDGKFKTYVNSVIPSDEVIELEKPFRGFKYYHAYTDLQLKSLKDLVIYLCDKYNIPKKFNSDMFDINTKALDGESGIWTHVSYRADKSDCFPQPKLIQILKEIEQGI